MAGVTRVRTGFDPARHAPAFPNCFPRGTPVVTVPTPFGRVRVGDACHGLCGGMVFCALDCFLWDVPAPTEPTPAVVRYLSRRLLDSWAFPFGVGAYWAWQSRPQASVVRGGVRVAAGTTRLTVVREWPGVRAQLDAGMPVPLGVVLAHSVNPRHLPRNHQVLATGYDLTDAEVAVRVYDPNHPADRDTTITLALTDPDAGRPFRHSVEGDTVRGVFAAAYARPDGPPAWG